MRNMLSKYIAVRGGLREKRCDPSTCDRDEEVKSFRAHTKAALSLATQDSHQDSANQDLRVEISSLSSEALAELMVLAFLGRMATKRQPGEVDFKNSFLEYDTVTHQMTVEEPQCALHDAVYQIMVSISVLAIICIMLIQSVAKSVKQEPPVYEPLPSGPQADTKDASVVSWTNNDNRRTLRGRESQPSITWKNVH
jgi:hypothetical protein